MYCSKETVKLAISKGYKHCTCSNGGYPDCICDNNPNSPCRLDDLQRWLREQHNREIEISQHAVGGVSTKRYRVFLSDYGFMYGEGLNRYLELPTYELALEAAILESLELI